MSNNALTPTFSERKAARLSGCNIPELAEVLVSDSESELPTAVPSDKASSVNSHVGKPKPTKQLAPLPDVIRQHRLPLTMKHHGDSLQVYLHSYLRTNEDGMLVYDVIFDDGTIKPDVPRADLHIPASTNYQILQLQESQTSVRTPTREERKKARRANRN